MPDPLSEEPTEAERALHERIVEMHEAERIRKEIGAVDTGRGASFGEVYAIAQARGFESFEMKCTPQEGLHSVTWFAWRGDQRYGGKIMVPLNQLASSIALLLEQARESLRRVSTP